jgi:hypothetical protein
MGICQNLALAGSNLHSGRAYRVQVSSWLMMTKTLLTYSRGASGLGRQHIARWSLHELFLEASLHCPSKLRMEMKERKRAEDELEEEGDAARTRIGTPEKKGSTKGERGGTTVTKTTRIGRVVKKPCKS